MKRINKALFGLMAACAMTTAVYGQNNKAEDPIKSHIDTSVRPSDDFFSYANGSWFKSHPIPASETSNGIFDIIDDTIQAHVFQICKKAAAQQNAKGSNKQKIGDLYTSGMDSIGRNRRGISELKPYLQKIDKMKSLADLSKQAAWMSEVAGTPFFHVYVAQDDKNSGINALQTRQGGLTLSRRYYIDNDKNSVEMRGQLVEFAKRLFKKLGYSNTKAEAAAKSQLALEMKIAKVSRKAEDLREPFKNYNKMSIKDASKLIPSFNWNEYLQGIGLGKADSIIVGQPEFLTGLNTILRQATISQIKDYMKFNLVDSYASYLDDETAKINFDFYMKALRGVEEQKPRWKQVVDVTNGSLGDLIGQVYVNEYLPKGTKEKFIEIGDAIKNEFRIRILDLDWMSAETKIKALKKLEALNMKLAYPDKWKDMSTIEISPNSYFSNIVNINKWGYKKMIEKFGKPVDRNEWDMQPQTYNAYYNPSNNEICIPGCNIIVPGFEGRMPDDAILYAIIGGSTFGHEVTHGFDDEGCMYDAKGNLCNWWTDEDKAKFDAKTKMIVEQFNNYVAIDTLHINGENTQGENIADLGGVVMGFEAFKKTEQYKNNVVIGGLTPTQRYFHGYAQAWMVQYRPQTLAHRVKSDVHSPAKWRVLGPLANNKDFYEAFGVKEGDKMWRSEKDMIKIW